MSNFSDFNKFQQAFEVFRKDADDWLLSNSLVDLKAYEDLQKKSIIGSCYRDDQNYFEQVSIFKAKCFSVKSYLVKLDADNSDRVLSRKIESLLSYLDNYTKKLDTCLSVAKQRIKFYESVIYLVSNMSYGDF